MLLRGITHFLSFRWFGFHEDVTRTTIEAVVDSKEEMSQMTIQTQFKSKKTDAPRNMTR
jgi:hypothetical protein